MRERERDHDAVGGDLAEAVGEVPEERQQARVDALEAVDADHHAEVVRALGGARDERGHERRPVRGDAQEAAVEHRQARRLDDAPADLVAHRRVGAAVVAGAQQHPGTDQLAAARVGDRHVADHQALRARAGRARRRRRRRVSGDHSPVGSSSTPATACWRARDALGLGQHAAQSGVVVEHVDEVLARTVVLAADHAVEHVPVPGGLAARFFTWHGHVSSDREGSRSSF